jgi:hypothetical protein
MKYWNKCGINEIQSTPNIPCEVYLIIDFLDFEPHFRFEIFASCCKKFEDKNKRFDFQRFKPGDEIEIKIRGHLKMHETENQADDNRYWNEGFMTMINSTGSKKYFVMGKVIDENPYDCLGGKMKVMNQERR